MAAVKRKMPPASLLQRRVKPRYEPEPESDVEDDLSEAPSEEDAGSLGSDDEEDEELSEDGSSQAVGCKSLSNRDKCSNHSVGELRRRVR